MAVITLTTDFGCIDPFVGIMKGVVLGICPSATLVDLTHGIPPQDVRRAAWTVFDASTHFPDGTIHVVVVDPGVGTARAALAVKTARHHFVAPDNGVLTRIFRREPIESVVRLEKDAYFRRPVSTTFHGRDIFAPVAAHLANGVPIDELGPAHGSPLELDLREPTVRDDGIDGEVIAVDVYGNLVTNIDEASLAHWPASRDAIVFHVGNLRIKGLRRTFGDVGEGEAVGYVGSSGVVELAVRNGNAHEAWQFGVGAPVRLTT